MHRVRLDKTKMDLESHLEILRRQEQRRHKFLPAQSDGQKTRNENERQYRMEQAVAGLLQVCQVMKIFFNSHGVGIFVEFIFRL